MVSYKDRIYITQPLKYFVDLCCHSICRDLGVLFNGVTTLKRDQIGWGWVRGYGGEGERKRQRVAWVLWSHFSYPLPLASSMLPGRVSTDSYLNVFLSSPSDGM